MSIDNNGLITGVPNRSGKFVVSVCVSEYDRSTRRLLGVHHKDLLITVYNCETRITRIHPCAAEPLQRQPGAQRAYHQQQRGGLHLVLSLDLQRRHRYDHLLPAMYSSTSFPDTGIYTVKLVVNPGLPCTDSMTGRINNYPGLRSGFTLSGLCRENPVFFTDTSSYRYGSIVYRKWILA